MKQIPQELSALTRSVRTLAQDRFQVPNDVWKAITDIDTVMSRPYMSSSPAARSLMQKAQVNLRLALETIGGRTKNVQAVRVYLDRAASKVEEAFEACQCDDSAKSYSPRDTVSFRSAMSAKTTDTQEAIEYATFLIKSYYRGKVREYGENSRAAIVEQAFRLVDALFTQNRDSLESSQQHALFKAKDKLKKAHMLTEKMREIWPKFDVLIEENRHLEVAIDDLRRKRPKNAEAEAQIDGQLKELRSRMNEINEGDMRNYRNTLAALSQERDELVEQTWANMDDAVMTRLDWREQPEGVNKLKATLNAIRLVVNWWVRSNETSPRKLLEAGKRLSKLVIDAGLEAQRIYVLVDDQLESDLANLLNALRDEAGLLTKAPNSRPEFLGRLAKLEPKIEEVIEQLSKFQRGRPKSFLGGQEGVASLGHPMWQGDSSAPHSPAEEDDESLPFGIQPQLVPRNEAPAAPDAKGSATVHRLPAQFGVGWELWVIFDHTPKTIMIIGRTGKSFNDRRQAYTWVRRYYSQLGLCDPVSFGQYVRSLSGNAKALKAGMDIESAIETFVKNNVPVIRKGDVPPHHQLAKVMEVVLGYIRDKSVTPREAVLLRDAYWGLVTAKNASFKIHNTQHRNLNEREAEVWEALAAMKYVLNVFSKLVGLPAPFSTSQVGRTYPSSAKTRSVPSPAILKLDQFLKFLKREHQRFLKEKVTLPHAEFDERYAKPVARVYDQLVAPLLKPTDFPRPDARPVYEWLESTVHHPYDVGVGYRWFFELEDLTQNARNWLIQEYRRMTRKAIDNVQFPNTFEEAIELLEHNPQAIIEFDTEQMQGSGHNMAEFEFSLDMDKIETVMESHSRQRDGQQ